MAARVRLVYPSSRDRSAEAAARLATLPEAGIEVLFTDTPPDSDWQFTSSSASERAQQLVTALASDAAPFVLCGRGGYGASDLLDMLPWDELRAAPQKILVGHSDISALHAALWTHLGWPSIHGPMPESKNWDMTTAASQAMVTLLRDGEFQSKSLDEQTMGGMSQKQKIAGRIPVHAFTPENDTAGQHANGEAIAGWTFGGCFSVLTNLLGTRHFPRSLAGAILFFEDLNESPPRLMRQWNQWIQADVLHGVRALVLGQFTSCGPDIPDNDPRIHREFCRRSNLPTYVSSAFGHVLTNFPIGVGASALLTPSELHWSIP